jgi:hypothetical protein
MMKKLLVSTSSTLLLLTTVMASQHNGLPVVYKMSPAGHEKVSCGLHEVNVIFYDPIPVNHFDHKSLYVTKEGKPLYGQVSAQGKFLTLTLGKPLPCNSTLMAHIHGVNYLNQADNFAWLFSTSDQYVQAPKPIKCIALSHDDPRALEQKDAACYSAEEAKEVDQKAVFRLPVKEENVASKNTVSQPSSKAKPTPTPPNHPSSTLKADTPSLPSWFVLPRIGYSSASVTSRYQTTPTLTKDTEAQNTLTTELLVGWHHPQNPYRVYAKLHQTKWDNGVLAMYGIGADYLFSITQTMDAFVGASVGQGMFDNDLTHSDNSGSVYGVNIGVTKPYNKTIHLEVGYAYNTIDLEAKRSTTTYERSITLDRVQTIFAGVNVRF